MIENQNGPVMAVSVSESAEGEDRVLITFEPGQNVLAFTAAQARLLSTQIIQAVQRVEVKNSLLQPKQALYRSKPQRIPMENASLAK